MLTKSRHEHFLKFKSLIHQLDEHFSDQDIINPHFLLHTVSKKNLEIYYAPFEYMNPNAKVVMVGITPGLQQMKKAYVTALEGIKSNLTDEEILQNVKKKASLAGTMRKNLYHMLDNLELPDYLGINATEELFANKNYLLHNTSVIRYPVFAKRKNYTGSTPKVLKTAILSQYAAKHFTEEMSYLKHAFIIPMGKNVSEVIQMLIDKNFLNKEQCLLGFPHPSGANGHRKRQYEENFANMKEKMEQWFS